MCVEAQEMFVVIWQMSMRPVESVEDIDEVLIIENAHDVVAIRKRAILEYGIVEIVKILQGGIQIFK